MCGDGKEKNVQTKTRWKFPARFFMMLFIRRRLVSPFISPTGEDLSRTHDTISTQAQAPVSNATRFNCFDASSHVDGNVTFDFLLKRLGGSQSHSVLLYESRVNGKAIKSAQVTVRVSLYLEAKSFPQFLLLPVYDQQHRPEILKHPRSCDLSCLTFQIIIRWFIVRTCVIPFLTSLICMGLLGAPQSIVNHFMCSA